MTNEELEMQTLVSILAGLMSLVMMLQTVVFVSRRNRIEWLVSMAVAGVWLCASILAGSAGR
jgi:uncharacterized membrane protein